MKFKRQMLVCTLATAMLFSSAMLATPNETQLPLSSIQTATAATINVTTSDDLLSAIANAADGDTIILEAGTYGEVETDIILPYVQNITIQAAEGAEVIFDARLKTVHQPWNASTLKSTSADTWYTSITLDGLTFNNGFSMEKQTIDIMTVKNCTFNMDEETTVDWVYFADPSFQGGTVTTLVFDNNIMNGTDQSAVVINGIKNITITNSDFNNTSGSSIEVWSKGTTETVTITGNTFDGAPVSVKDGSKSVTISNNEFTASSDFDSYGLYMDCSVNYDKTTSPWTNDYTTDAAALGAVTLEDNEFTGFECNMKIGMGYAAIENPVLIEGTALTISNQTYYTADITLANEAVISDTNIAAFEAKVAAAVYSGNVNTVYVTTSNYENVPVHAVNIPDDADVEIIAEAKIEGKGYYANFTDALAAATEGDTIIVCEDIETAFTINKEITLQARADSDIDIEGCKVTVTASNVTIDGFQFDNAGIYTEANIENLKITNNSFELGTGTSVYYGVQINNGYTYNADDAFVGYPISGLTISNNTFEGYEGDGATRAAGILIGSIEDATTITGNTFTNMRNYYAIAIAGSPDGTLKITNNVFDGWDGRQGDNPVETAVYLGQMQDSSYGQMTLEDQETATITLTGNKFLFNEDLLGIYAINGEGLFDGEGIDHTYNINDNYWGSDDFDFATLCPEITNVVFDDVYYYSDEAMTTLVSNGSKTVVSEAKDALTNVDSLNADDHADDIVAAALVVADLNKEELKTDSSLVEDINTLDTLFAAANDNVTVVETDLNTDDVEYVDQITVGDAEGLAVAYYGDGDAPTDAANAAELSLTVTQQDASSSEADVIFTAKPQVSTDGGATTTVIDNSEILAPITFNVYLPTTFTSNYAKVLHIKTSGDTEELTLKVQTDADGNNYIRVTVSEFSEFQVTQYQVSSSSSVKKYSNDLEVGDNGSAYATPLSAASGTTVYINVTPDTGYEVDEVIVDGGDIDVTDEGDGSYSYKQPAYAVDIEVTFQADGTVDEEEVEEEVTEEEATEALTEFADVVAGAWYEEYIAAAVEEGIMNGNSETEFAPQGTTTRAMMIQVLFNMSDEPETENDESAWYSEALAWGMEFGITDGSEITGDLTREQLVTMLYRYAMSNGVDTSAVGDLTTFGDYETVSEYAADAFAWAVAEGIINGSDGNLNPQGNATRAELAKIMVSYLGE